jgi:hypothetical protein
MYGCHSKTTQTIYVIEAIIALVSAVIGLLLLVQNRNNSQTPKAKSFKTHPYFKILFGTFLRRLFTHFTHLCQKILAVTRLAISKTFATSWQLLKGKSSIFFTTMDHSKRPSEEKCPTKGNE